MTDQSRKVFKKNPEILNDILLYQKNPYFVSDKKILFNLWQMHLREDTGTAQDGEQVGHEKYLLV